jgi:hypothetical protein
MRLAEPRSDAGKCLESADYASHSYWSALVAFPPADLGPEQRRRKLVRLR